MKIAAAARVVRESLVLPGTKASRLPPVPGWQFSSPPPPSLTCPSVTQCAQHISISSGRKGINNNIIDCSERDAVSNLNCMLDLFLYSFNVSLDILWEGGLTDFTMAWNWKWCLDELRWRRWSKHAAAPNLRQNIMTSNDLNFEKNWAKVHVRQKKLGIVIYCPRFNKLSLSKTRRGVDQFISEIRFDNVLLTNFSRFTFISDKVLAKTGLRKS